MTTRPSEVTQVVEPDQGFVERAAGLDHIVVLAVQVGVQRNPYDQVWVADFRQTMRVASIAEEASVRQDVERGAGQDLLAPSDDIKQAVAEQSWLTARDAELLGLWAHELDRAKQLFDPA